MELLLVTCVDGVSCGRMMWTFVTNGPMVSNFLFGNNPGVIYCLGDKGELISSFVGSSQIYCSSCTYPNIVSVSQSKDNSYISKSIFTFTIFTSGVIYLLRLLSGECVMSCYLLGEIFSSPVLVHNDTLVGCRGNFLYCLTVNSQF